MTVADQLRAAAAIPDGEMRSRKNAIAEIKALMRRAAADLEASGPEGEQSSPEMATLAAKVLNGNSGYKYTPTEAEVRSLAASVLTQAPDLGTQTIDFNPVTSSAEARALADAVSENQAKPMISRKGNES